MALGPLLKGLQTGKTDGLSVTGILPSEQPVAHQKPVTALADLDRRDHDHAPGAVLTEASCTDGGFRFVGHVTGCYYDSNKGHGPTVGIQLSVPLISIQTPFPPHYMS